MSGSAGVLSIVGVVGTSMIDGVVNVRDLGFLGWGRLLGVLSEAGSFLLLVTAGDDITGYICLFCSGGTHS